MDDIAAWLENYKLSYPKPKRWEKKMTLNLDGFCSIVEPHSQ